MSAKHHLHVAASIPPHLTPGEVIAALQDHSTTLSLQALTTGHEKLPNTAPEILKDTYWFPTDLNPVHTYSVTECVTILPGVGQMGRKNITFPSCYQNIPSGIKSRADVSGVTVRAEYRVIKGGMESEVAGEGQGIGEPSKMELAHRDICRKVIEKVEMQRRQVDLAQSVGRSLQVDGASATPAEAVAPEQQVAELAAPGSQKIFYA